MSLLLKTSELFEACRMADFDVLEDVLTTKNKERHENAHRDLHEYREHKTGMTPLLLVSCNTHNSDLVVLLYQHGAKLDQLGLHRETCLHLAARQAREDVLGKLLIALDDDPITKKKLIDKRDDEGSTPLMCACFAGDIPCMRLLREHGAFLDHRNYRGQTPLMKAVCFRNARVVDWLLTAQVDTLLRDKEDKQAADYAKERGLHGMVEKISGKTITDEMDEWIDEKAHVTGAHDLLLQRTRAAAAEAEAAAAAAAHAVWSPQSLEEMTAQTQEWDSFQSSYGADGPSIVERDMTAALTADYSYTPLADESDPYQLYEREKIDSAWQEFMDYENDCPYWYNNLTNESVYERPWVLGGPIEQMDPNVATAKATLFKSMLSTGAGAKSKEDGEGKVREAAEEKVHDVSDEGKSGAEA